MHTRTNWSLEFIGATMLGFLPQRWWYWFIGVPLAAGLALAANAGTTVHGDKIAWSEINEAFSKLRRLPGYRVRQFAGRTVALFEVAPPTSVHITAEVAPGLGLEMIVVGKEGRSRDIRQGSAGGWRCGAPPGAGRTLSPDKFQGEVTVSRGVDDKIEDIPVHAYSLLYKLRSENRETDMRQDIWIAAQTSLPKRLVVTTPEGQLTQIFFDYGATISLTLPPCS